MTNELFIPTLEQKYQKILNKLSPEQLIKLKKLKEEFDADQKKRK